MSTHPAWHGEAAGIFTSVPTQSPFDTVAPTDPGWVSDRLAISEVVLLQMLPEQHCHASSGDITTFANRREAYLAKALVPRFHMVVSEGEVEDIECRVSICKIRIRVADNPEDYARMQLAWGDAVTVEPAAGAGHDPGYRTVEVYALTSADHRDHDRFEAVSAELLAERDPDQPRVSPPATSSSPAPE